LESNTPKAKQLHQLARPAGAHLDSRHSATSAIDNTDAAAWLIEAMMNSLVALVHHV
jgi:hypothetical protein